VLTWRSASKHPQSLEPPRWRGDLTNQVSLSVPKLTALRAKPKTPLTGKVASVESNILEALGTQRHASSTHPGSTSRQTPWLVAWVRLCRWQRWRLSTAPTRIRCVDRLARRAWPAKGAALSPTPRAASEPRRISFALLPRCADPGSDHGFSGHRLLVAGPPNAHQPEGSA
jgi:hypothetical protein